MPFALVLLHKSLQHSCLLPSKIMFRPINRTIGLSPKIGSLALYQVLPFGAYAATAYYLKEILGFSWLAYAVMVSLMTGATFLLLGDKPWLFFSRIMEVPYLVRGGTLYQPLLGEGVGSARKVGGRRANW